MGAVRDLDVLIVRFQNELTNLTEVEQTDIRGVIEHLQQKHKEARQPMLTLFKELEETDFETEFLEFFEDHQSTSPNRKVKLKNGEGAESYRCRAATELS